MRIKKFILWPVSHIEEFTRQDLESLMGLIGTDKVTLFFEFGGSQQFDKLICKLLNKASDCEAEIAAFIDMMGVAEAMRKHVAGKFMLIKQLAECTTGIEVVPIDYRPERRKDMLSEMDYMFYTHDSIERGIANTPQEKSATILNIMQGNSASLKKLLVDEAFTLIGVEKRDIIRESTMLDRIGQRLDKPDNPIFMTIIGAYHAGTIGTYLERRGDVNLISFVGGRMNGYRADFEKASALGARMLVSDDVYDRFASEAIDISKLFLGTDVLTPYLRSHYSNTRDMVLAALPEDKDLQIDKAFAMNALGNFVAIMAHFPTLGQNEEGEEIARDAMEFGNGIDANGTVRFQTLYRVFRRFSSALASGSWDGKEVELAEQIFRTETERDNRKLARREERQKSVLHS